eukprot:NODE_3861_length_1971_cov_55.816161.p1 GENE.NODE_3861_length_1971_cov_55.816161~~NODE_3861_length_1971_cov_55.816161.p1  ORF type:complete len:539 (+),score=113.85 NODE_3861_length_1971_cov_55.816161:1-1617(+)
MGGLQPTSLFDLSGGGLAGGDAGGEPAPVQTQGSGSYTLAEVAKHTTNTDCWVVINGSVLNVTDFLKDHPGGELAIMTFAGKDASEEFNMIHPPDVIGKYAPYAILGPLGDGSPELPQGQAYYSLADVASHLTNTDCWVVVNGTVLDVTDFLKDHPGGELAIMTFAGKDASEEFNMIHPPDVIGKYAPKAVIGKIGDGGAVGKGKAAKAHQDTGDKIANHHAWGVEGSHNWRIEAMDENPGVFIINIKAYWFATWHLIIALFKSVLSTILTPYVIQSTLAIDTKDRRGLTRSAIFLIFFIVIHAVGNLHIFLGPDDFNGYGYFYVRLYWTGFGLPANIVEEYVLLAALLHVLVALLRTNAMWRTKVTQLGFGKAVQNGNLNLISSGVLLLAFMTFHLLQFRFGATHSYWVRPPPCLINFYGIFSLNLFWDYDPSITPVPVRDIYKLEYEVFSHLHYVIIYIVSVIIFVFHACAGWLQLTMHPSFGIPKLHQRTVRNLGWIIFFAIGFIYLSFPLYCSLTTPFEGYTPDLQHPSPLSEG